MLGETDDGRAGNGFGKLGHVLRGCLWVYICGKMTMVCYGKCSRVGRFDRNAQSRLDIGVCSLERR